MFLFIHAAVAALTAADTAPTPRVPVIVELFTSQGCSSCPPADDVLRRLDEQQPVKNAEVIALSEHVDYWNSLGWKDPFSSRQFSLRQQEYAELFRARGSYTPQMVVNGRVEFIGSDLRTARREIERAAEAGNSQFRPANVRVTAGAEGGSRTLDVKIDQLPAVNANDTAVVWLAITESGLSNPVNEGENKGRMLTHVGVVRTLVRMGEIKRDARGYAAQAKVPADKSWKKDLKAVVFVQEAKAKRILGAASLKL